jgi:hypothetical protein
MATTGKGEGDYESGRKYQEKTKEFVKSGKVPDAAEKAKKAVEDDEENAELEKAKEKGRSKADYDDI